jgi:TolB-like protein/Tfp pilus assembly protein PilF
LVDAFSCLEKAIALDPEFSDAHSYLSYCLFSAFMMSWPGVTGTLDQALASAQTAVSLDPNSAMAHTRLGWVLGFLEHFDDAVDSFETALSLEPDLAEVYSAYGEILNFAGDPEKGLQFCERALQLDPYAPITWKFHLGHSYYDLGRLEEAIQVIEEVVNVVPKFFIPRLFLACAYVENAQVQKACDLIEEAGFSEDFFPQFAQKWPSYKNDDSRDRVYTALCKAGLSAGGIDKEEVSALPLPDKPSIAVLPFDNMSGDLEQEYFSDGITEDIITALSRIRQFFVIARNTTFTYKGQAVDVPVIARELGVRYVLEGSVRKAGNRIRITAQLIDGESGNHLWAERYDRELEDIFEVQDDITQTVVGALGPELSRAEQERSRHKPQENMDAWDFYQRGLWHMWRFEENDNSEARGLFRRATDIDPNLSPAFAALAFTHVQDFLLGFTEDRTVAIEGAKQFAEQALKLDEREAFAYAMRGVANLIRRDHPSARNDLKAALNIVPGYAFALMTMGMSHTWCGQPDKAIPYFDEAERNSPKDPMLWLILMGRTLGFLIEGKFEDADTVGKRAIALPNAPLLPRVIHTAALGHLGRTEEAQIAINTMLRINPSFCLNFVDRVIPTNEKNVREVILEGLRKAGVPKS